MTSAGTGGFTGGSFETWLSRLADEQPYLSVGQNLENQALFQRFSEAIATVLGENVHAALTSGCPAWLNEFIRVAHQRRANLVTFNYDPLIECAVATGLLYERGHYDSVFWPEITWDVPSWSPGLANLAADKGARRNCVTVSARLILGHLRVLRNLISTTSRKRPGCVCQHARLPCGFRVDHNF